MSPNDKFTISAPNGEDIVAVCVDVIDSFTEVDRPNVNTTLYLCYGKNKLFVVKELEYLTDKGLGRDYIVGKTLIDYIDLPYII